MSAAAGEGVSKARLEALCDGVFAIVMTLLVLELMGGPLATAESASEVDAALLHLGPKAAAFVISFVITAIFWVGHHAQLHWVRATDRRHLWLNILFLLMVTLLPFAAAVLGEHPGVRSAVVIYGAVVIGSGAALLAQWTYAVRRGLLRPETPSAIVRGVRRRLVGGQVAYWAALAVAWVSPAAAFALYVAFALAYVAVQLRPDVTVPHPPASTEA